MSVDVRDSAAVTRTLEVTLGRVRLVEHTWPADARAPAEHHAAAHACFLIEGGLEERRGRRGVWRVAPHVRASPMGDAHACCYGHSGGRCLVIEPLPDVEDPSAAAPHAPIFLNDPAILQLAALIYGEVGPGGRGTASPLVVESLTMELMAQAARRERPRAAHRPPAWLERVREVLVGSLAEPPDLGSLARIAGVHRVNVARAFRDHYGSSVGEYVRRLRVERARVLLVETDVPLVEVALRAGFFDQSHMTRAVARFMGTTPAVIRNDARHRHTG